MIYQSVSIKEVIARVVRNTRIQDSSYLEDMNVWIPQAMGYMKTQYNLSLRHEDVAINFHKGKMPCDLKYIEAIEYRGYRLPYSSTVKEASTGHNIGNENIQDVKVFSSILTAAQNNSENAQFLPTQEGSTDTTLWNDFSTFQQLCECQYTPSHWYQTELDYVVTSFSQGVIRIHYRGVPIDEDGLPLIPDNEDYKEALYWYVRSKMYGAGYEEKQYQEQDMMYRFEKHAARAIGQITYPTPDMKEQQIKTQVRFIPAPNYYDNFFRVDNNERNYGY